MDNSVRFYKKTKTKNGKDVSSWLVNCINCGRERIINRKDHAVRLSKTNCKFCSNKSNHPQGEYEGIRISFFNKYKLSANSRSLDFEIDIEFASNLAKKQDYKCRYSGIDLKFNGDFKQITASIDRIDSSIGYIKNNVCWVHKDINMMKQQFSEEKFIEMCQLVANKAVCKH
jgi:hypothetical protein